MNQGYWRHIGKQLNHAGHAFPMTRVKKRCTDCHSFVQDTMRLRRPPSPLSLSLSAIRLTSRRKKATPESDARSWCTAGPKMESDTTVRRLKPLGTYNYVAQDNDVSRGRCGDNGYSGDPKRKPEVSLYLLREGLAASLVSVFILVLWGLVHLSLQQLVIGKLTGEFNAERARWAKTLASFVFMFWLTVREQSPG